MIRKDTIVEVDTSFGQKIGSIDRVMHFSCMFPIDCFAGEWVADRKIRIICIACNIEPALISERLTIRSQVGNGIY